MTKLKSLARITKLSKLLRIGLDDLRKQQQDINSTINMGYWWKPQNSWNTVCVTCLAGSVMKHSLELSRPNLRDDREVCPADYDVATEDRLLALDDLRSGYIRSAAEKIGVTTLLSDRPISYFDDATNGTNFFEDMEQLYRDLVDVGE